MFNIILIGMPGCGKSTIGAKLAKKIGLKLIDLDFLIEKNEQMKISDIFKNKGEKFFRNLETNAIKNIKKDGFILSTGGGIVETSENIPLLKKLGKIFYLEISPEKIFDRIKDDTKRPLLQNNNPKKTLEILYLNRFEKYNSAADFKINADREINVIVDEIYEKINS